MSTLSRAAMAVALLLPSLATAETTPTPEVFDGPSIGYGNALQGIDGPASNILRTFQIEERVGVSRQGELARIPLFFAEGECPDLSTLRIVAAPADTTPSDIMWQADDIRRGPDGGISRVHLWIAVDLKADETRQYHLLRRPEAPASRSAATPMRVEATPEEIRITTDKGVMVWGQKGQLKALPAAGYTWKFDEGGALPRAVIKFPAREGQPAKDVILDRSTADRTVDWSSGPLFTKLRIRLRDPAGAGIEQVYRIPRHGREIVVTASLAPGDRAGSVVRENRLLEGVLVPAKTGKLEIQPIPAGLNYALRAEHAYRVSALKAPSGRGALLAIPLVMGGHNGVWAVDDQGVVALQGQRGLQRGKDEKDTLFAYGTEVRLVPSDESDPDRLWQTYRHHVQPLVAVVEEPGATVDRLHAVLREVAREMKPIGWRQEAGKAWVMGDGGRVAKILQGAPAAREQDRASLVRGASGARAKLTNNGERAVREHEKGKAYGALDPYHITYTQSVAAALSVLADAPPSVTAVNLAMAGGVREAGGLVDSAGHPYIDCFNRALNMQMGPVLFGLTAGADGRDPSLVTFYRDLATAPPVQAVFGRAQRPYTGAITKAAEQTDYLYQAICDFWLRSTELLANEDLGLHPLAYSRYTDCIDVTADLYHAVAATDKPDTGGAARANFFRGQVHTHRWLGWSCAPFIRLLEDPSRHGSAGLTAAIHHAENLKGRWKNWPDLTYYILTDMLVREGLKRYQAPELPAAPAELVIRSAGNATELGWKPVAGATEYRVYRAESPGGPYRWLNSPYVASPSPRLTVTTYRDDRPTNGATYLVTAVDAEGRASAWPMEPQPGETRNAGSAKRP